MRQRNEVVETNRLIGRQFFLIALHDARGHALVVVGCHGFGLLDPHPPYASNATWRAKVNASAVDAPPLPALRDMHPFDARQSLLKNVTLDDSPAQLRERRTVYWAAAAQALVGLEGVLAVARETGHLNNTVVTTSDNITTQVFNATANQTTNVTTTTTTTTFVQGASIGLSVCAGSTITIVPRHGISVAALAGVGADRRGASLASIDRGDSRESRQNSIATATRGGVERSAPISSLQGGSDSTPSAQARCSIGRSS